MSEMTSFRYAGFWDVPRHILLKYRDTWLFLFSEFDEALDEYSENYAVYRLPPSIEQRLENESWAFVYRIVLEGAVPCVGTIKVQDVIFDDTKRKTLDSRCLDDSIPFSVSSPHPLP